MANQIKSNMSTYQDAEDLINVGAYVSGSNPDIDTAIRLRKEIFDFITQDTHDKFEFTDTYNQMQEITSKI